MLSCRCEGHREVLVHRQELSMPPTITLDLALGFSLCMMTDKLGKLVQPI
jgi:hypothetical protein